MFLPILRVPGHLSRTRLRAMLVVKCLMLPKPRNVSRHIAVPSETQLHFNRALDLPVPYNDSQSNITIHVGEKRLDIPHKEVLNAFWAGHLDSTCEVCNGPFDDEASPPIRTISSNRHVEDHISARLRVHNRHFGCMTKDHWKKIIPISHAWHDPVAKAHATRRSSDDATALVLSVPSRILTAVQQRFRNDVEIWHDYVSVPQWQCGTQQSLLHMLPAIFRTAQDCIMHFDDVSTIVLRSITKVRPNIVPPLSVLAEYMRSKWYQRMWVCLECSFSRRAYVLSQEYDIQNISFKGIEAFMADHVVAHMSSCDRASFLAICKELNFDHLSVGSLSNIWRIKERLTLGAVYDILARKQCRTYRDRFIAACAFLNKTSYKDVVATLPSETTDACLWVSRMCLEEGDYTPLLLAPSLNDKDAEVPGARWLRGHKNMSVLTWRLGRIVHEADYPVIIRGGKIIPQLEVVGDITKWEYFSFATVDPVEGFSFLVDWIIAISTTSESQFLASIPRIYHFHSWNHIDPTTSIPSLGRRLAEYRSLDPLDTASKAKRLEIASDVVDLLRLFDRTDSGPSLLQYTAIMEQRYFVDKHALVVMCCPGCGGKAVQRVALWHAPEGHARLYRIPGLTYWRTSVNGVGLVMEGSRVIGRMLYGTPTCGCSKLESVEID